MYIVAVGSIDLGYRFVGPFGSEDQAQQWIDKQDPRLSKVAWPISLHTPAYAAKKAAEASAENPMEG
jgi:hypothetical protein